MKETMTGNRALLKIGGRIVGSGVQNVDFQDDFGLQRADGLGSPEAQELIVGAISHTIQLSTYRVSGKSLDKLGFTPTAADWLTSGELEIEIIDTISGETQEFYTGCKAANHSRTYAKHVISGESASFQALKKM